MRFLWSVALLPVSLFVIVAVIGLSAVLPWWAIAFGAAFWVLLARRRRLAASPVLEGSETAFSPFRGGGY